MSTLSNFFLESLLEINVTLDSEYQPIGPEPVFVFEVQDLGRLMSLSANETQRTISKIRNTEDMLIMEIKIL